MVLSLYFLFHQWELFADAQGRRLLPNLVNLWCSLFCISDLLGISAESYYSWSEYYSHE